MGATFIMEATFINSLEISQGYAYLGGYVYQELKSTWSQAKGAQGLQKIFFIIELMYGWNIWQKL